MSEVAIVKVGDVPDPVLLSTMHAITDVLGVASWLCDQTLEPAFALDPKRKQYDSTLLLKRLIASRPLLADRVLGITEGDLYIPMLTFVFGQAQMGGPAALVSTARLRQEFYGLSPDAELLGQRVQKEVLHELGHTLSLIHCPDATCAMSLATGIRLVDKKSVRYCESCHAGISVMRTETTR